MGTSSASPSSPVPRPCTTVDRPCTQAPGGLWDTPRLRRLGRGAALRTGSPSLMSLGRSGLPDSPDDRSSKPSATYKDAPEVNGAPQDHLGTANVTWIIRWRDLAQRNEVLPRVLSSPVWQDIFSRVPEGPASYLRIEAKFAD